MSQIPITQKNEQKRDNFFKKILMEAASLVTHKATPFVSIDFFIYCCIIH
jgi:hypothetical protein